ncbi:hypothetical protein BB737_11900 [Mycobacterium avium subsp. hominissuis]|nr:hypothetical protein O982_16965 [Mycobacterium avium 10-5581]PBJ35924.1 hypothetical protein BI294_13775 [Mycobacterium avium subsp. hominissuis]PBJ65591.1 hypothetical protein BB737_11900 [Mycobacterium avium subsp. hominissuis]
MKCAGHLHEAQYALGMWGHIVEAVRHWPWSTIAAFAAAGAALWIARAETRERSQALGRQVIVEVA